MPRIDYLAPYKNKFCKICNEVFNNEIHWSSETTRELIHDIVRDIGYGFQAPSYRVIFEFSNNKQSSKHNTETPRCNSSQIVFLNECRDIRCYPGRMLVDTGCTPLFQTTTNLGYILYGSLKTRLMNNVNASMPFFELVGESFKEFIRKRLNLWYIDFKTSITLSNLYCPRNQLNKLYKGDDVLILVYHKLFITESVNRSRTEEQLVSLLGSSFNVTYDDFEQTFLFERDAKAFHLPTVVSRMKFTDKCYTINEIVHSYPGQLYIHSHVNQLLVCEQIELNENEFSVNLKDLKLTIYSRNTDIELDDYMVISTRKARLCVNRLQSLNTRTDSNNSTVVWNTVALVFTCISLVCLGLTFFTYCFFFSLRTLPGKNNMCLVFAMFCAQFVFQFVEIGTKSDIGCKVIGVLIHYFWLVTFGCLNVCSFHMFYVFTSKTGIHISETSRLAVYILYSYGIPAIIVVLNIIITRSLSSGTLIGYGGRVCFLNQQIAFIVTFIVPISLVCFSNIFFFIGTALKIARRPKLKNDSQMRLNEIQFSVYVKLFSITGISWIFQIIDSFIPFSAFSTIVSLLNALQGVFIFISYVCNRRVLNLYKQTRKSLSENSNSKTSRHTTSTELSGI
ncbi:uncharacterized protein LOC134705320 [Mytilus trossulus]|uniref:uncharacterized protein LOC134705320 n=1 Tax=Mytilus trossulus TaxID=6551 RepID=UPI003006F56D